MKKVCIGILAAVMLLSLGTTSALAAGRGNGRGYVDEDGDGVCDNYNGACGYVDEDGDGVCDNYNGACGYVDEDGDGVCDNCGRYPRRSAYRTGYGRFFVDEDGDGVCDYYATGRVGRRGQGTGCRGRGNGCGGWRNR